MYTIKQVSDLAGVTPRTLRHYDAIGLLKPTTVGENGYRYYGDQSLLLLQQILFYREMGLGLDRIKEVVGREDFSVLAALESHKRELRRRIERLERLSLTVDETIDRIRGGKNMDERVLFGRFTDGQQEAYAAEAAGRWDPDVVAESQRRYKAYSGAERERIFAEANQVYAQLAAAIPRGADSAEAQALVERWRKHMEYFWTPPLEALTGLAELYNDDPRFKANFDGIDPRLAPFMRDAVAVYVRRKRGADGAACEKRKN
jgi:DNA-binding transcriptional MerR regulator